MNLIEEFVEYGKDEGKVNSEKTWKQYISVLKRFEKYLEEEFEVSIEKVGREHVRHYMDDLFVKKPVIEKEEIVYRAKTPSTVHNYMVIIQSFYRFLIEEKEMNINPAILKIKIPKLPPIDTLEPKYIEDKQLTRILAALEQEQLYYTIVRMMLDAGLRISEVLNLDIGDYSIAGARKETRPLTVRGKGDKVRVLPIPQLLAEALSKWERERDEKVGEIMENLERRLDVAQRRVDWSAEKKKKEIKLLEKKIYETKVSVFISRQGGRLDASTVQKRLNTLCQILNVGQKKENRLSELTPHMFRHTFAKKMIRKGASEADVAKALGHRSTQTTRRYVVAGVEEIAKFMED